MIRGGAAADARAVAFDQVRAGADGGGADDRAYLTGSSGNDRFYGYETCSYLIGPGYGYETLSVGFDHVEADMTFVSGGSDRADLFDTELSDDLFIGHTSPATNYGEITYEGGTYIKANSTRARFGTPPAAIGK